MGEDTETIRIGEVSRGEDAGAAVELPVVDVLTGRSFVTGKSGSGKSILGGTPVYTETGRKPIEEVEEGERVLSLNERTYEQEFRPVQATLEHEADDLVRITLEDGTELVGTEDHSFLTVQDLEIVPVRGENVEEGTWMPLSRSLPEPETCTEIDLGEYVTESGTLDIRDGEIRSASRVEDRYFELGAEEGRIVGLYLAEGSFDTRMTIQLSATDERVKEFLDGAGFNVYDRFCTLGFKPLAEFLAAEFSRGAADKRIPNWVFEAPAPFRAGLLSGYFDGDGTIGESATAMSKSRELLDGVVELLRQFGVSASLEAKYTTYNDETREYTRLRVDAFSIPTFAETVDLLINDKHEALGALVASLESGESYNAKDMVPNFGDVLNRAASDGGWNDRDGDDRSRAAALHNHTRKQKVGRETYNRAIEALDVGGRARQFGRSGVQWKRVASVESLDETRQVYDLDVELNDNFIADGVFVHNSNSASVICEKLLDQGYGLLVVDIDGEYYGLKEEYEILHVGADEECDLRVNVEHAEKIAELALEQNVPIILDVSNFLDESEARELLTAVTKQLFAKEKKLKQPFLMLIEEVHEYIPEGGGIDECGRMLIKVGKRGRKHGLGIVGISQRPADVKKDFITQCDWMVWHRLTWNNDTKVVGRILGGEYADHVEEMDDGECFLQTDYNDDVRVVQFERKRTFDAGATPGLEDFERPELKSVSGDLLGELEEITEAQQQRQNRIADLERELERKEERIDDLERQLAEAQDLKRMADRFSRAMMEQVTGRPLSAASVAGTQAELGDPAAVRRDPELQADLEAVRNGERDPMPSPVPDAAEEHAGSAPERSELADDEPTSGPIDDLLEQVADTRATELDATRGNDPPGRSGALTPDTGPDAPSEDSPAFRADESLVDRLRREIDDLSDTERGMLRHYREHGPATPQESHAAAGGSGDRTDAYAANRSLRERGLVEHAARGRHDYALPSLVVEESIDPLAPDERIPDDERDRIVRAVEASFVDEVEAPPELWLDDAVSRPDA